MPSTVTRHINTDTQTFTMTVNGRRIPKTRAIAEWPDQWTESEEPATDHRLNDNIQAAINEAISEGNVSDVDVTPPTPTLEGVKAEKIAEIDHHTSELIKAGFAHDGNSFSMSENAQRNWTGLGTAHALGMIPFPYAISTADEGTYILADADSLLAFLGAYLTYQADPTKPLGSGRALKAQVNACETIDAVEAIVDDRT